MATNVAARVASLKADGTVPETPRTELSTLA